MSITNTAQLRGMLLETIEEVKKGSIDPRQAGAIASLSAKVIHSAKLDLDVKKFNLSVEGMGRKTMKNEVLSLVETK